MVGRKNTRNKGTTQKRIRQHGTTQNKSEEQHAWKISNIILSCFLEKKESINICTGSVIIKNNQTEILIDDDNLFKKIRHMIKEETCIECDVKMLKYYSKNGKTLYQCPTCNKFYEGV